MDLVRIISAPWTKAPQARGWTSSITSQVMDRLVSPAGAGMDPLVDCWRIPTFPPQARGWDEYKRVRDRSRVSPAGAGMDLQTEDRGGLPGRFPPQARGWTLTRTCFPHVSPAGAGMDHGTDRTWSFPRRRGDGPLGNHLWFPSRGRRYCLAYSHNTHSIQVRSGSREGRSTYEFTNLSTAAEIFQAFSSIKFGEGTEFANDER